MRKTSKQILKEIRLDQELAQFPFRNKLIKCIDDMCNFRVNELEAYYEMKRIVKGNSVLESFITTKVVEHTKSLLALTSSTVDGFKSKLDDIDRLRKVYEERRNKIVP